MTSYFIVFIQNSLIFLKPEVQTLQSIMYSERDKDSSINRLFPKSLLHHSRVMEWEREKKGEEKGDRNRNCMFNFTFLIKKFWNFGASETSGSFFKTQITGFHPTFPIQEVWFGAQIFAFLTSSQVSWCCWPRPDCEKCCPINNSSYHYECHCSPITPSKPMPLQAHAYKFHRACTAQMHN